jgi:hypothetical protein
VLANIFEAAGLATVGISLVRRQAENGRAPRMLHCQFPLGRPLGRPGDPAFQREVLRRAFALLERTDVPVLEDHPEVIDDETGSPAACPLPPRHDPDLPAEGDEALGLRNAYERNLDETGRTMMGRVGSADDIAALIGAFIALRDGATPADVGWDDATLPAAAQDVRAFYEEAGVQLAGASGARQIETWLYTRTQTGALLAAVQTVLKDAGAEFTTWYYLLPGSQS